MYNYHKCFMLDAVVIGNISQSRTWANTSTNF